MRRISGESQINPPLWTVGAEDYAQIVTFPDGAFGVVYKILNVQLETQRIPQGDYTVGSNPGLQIVGAPSVAYAPEHDSLTVVWETADFKIRGSVTHEDGTGDPFFPNSAVIADDSTDPNGAFLDSSPDLAFAHPNDLPFSLPIVVYERQCILSAGPFAGSQSHQTVVDVFDVDLGGSLFMHTFIESAFTFEETTPSVAAGPQNFLVAYAKGGNIEGAFYGYTGNVSLNVGAADHFTHLTLADHPEGIFDPDVQYLGNNRYVVVFRSATDVFAQIWQVVDPTHIALVTEVTVSQSGSAAKWPHVAALPGGGFVVAWQDVNVDGNGQGILERIFDSSGNPVGPHFGNQFVVNTFADGDQVRPSVAVNGTTILTTWTDFGVRSTDTDPPGIRGQFMSVAVPTDFNGDLRTDILWRNTVTGEVDTWLIDNAHVAGATVLGSVSSAWRLVCIADINATAAGAADVVWQNTATGAVESWLLNNGHVVGGGGVGFASSVWQPLGSGDFNPDGTPDVLWRNTVTGEVDTWLLTNGKMVGGAALGSVSSAWQFAGMGDFNGDGTTDIVWHNTITGEVDTWLVSNDHVTGGAAIGTASSLWQALGCGDFNGDGISDILWRNTATGEVATWLVSNGHVVGGATLGTLSSAWQLAGIGDLKGDGRSSILWRNTATGEVDTWLIFGDKVTGGSAIGATSTVWQPQVTPTS